MNDTEKLRNLELAPYIIRATALIGKHREVGGNQFRHAMSTMSILLDYKLFDNPVILKAAVIHDLIEDIPEINENELRRIDADANRVVDLVLEVSRPEGVEKEDYLNRLLKNGSRNAKLLKVADRIQNLTDLHRDQYSRKKMRAYVWQTEKYILPMAREVNKHMAMELADLIKQRKKQLRFFKFKW